MNIAVSKGAKEHENFLFYVNYLANNGYVSPDAKGWVDHIRLMGNEATHEIALINAEDAKDLLSFVEMLLKTIFEYPERVKRRGQPSNS